MPTSVFQALKNISWECTQCGLPNFSTSLFNTTILDSSNSFGTLNPSPNDDPELSFSNPGATSSPKANRSNRPGAHPPKKDTPVRTLVINCQSARSKKPLLETVVNTTDADIIIGTESWLDSSINSNEVFPTGYVAYRRDRPSGKHGGVFILVSTKLESSQTDLIQHQSDSEMLWIKIKIKGSKDLYVCAYYKKPDLRQPGCFMDLNYCLQSIPPDSHIWMGGDFNLADIDWELDAVRPGAAQVAMSNELLSVAQDANLAQMVDEPTRITDSTSTTLDLFFTNNHTLINSVKVIPGISDHEAVYVESSLHPIATKTARRKILRYHKANFATIMDELINFQNEFQESASQCNINDLWITLRSKITSLIQEHIPSKDIMGNNNHKPWISPHIKTIRRKLSRLFKKCKESTKSSLRAKYQQAKAKTQREQRQSYWQYINSLISPPDDNDMPNQGQSQKRFWSYIKSLRRDNNGVAPLKKNGSIFCTATDKANILNQQYQSVFTREDLSNIPSPPGEPFPPMANITISVEGVLKLLKKINPHKAAGPDNIPARVLKECATALAPLLEIIFTKSLIEGAVPDDWRRANVSAIFKKGDRSNAANYRPVSLTSICCKIQEHIICSNVMRHLQQHRILCDSQHGFRPRRSCETQLLSLTHELACNRDKGLQTDLIILDFSKAFDKVPHERLLRKLDHYGVRGSTFNWVKAFLSDRSQQVVVDGARSDPAPVISGVPQGSVLGPILFLIFINDLPDQLKSKARLFADDCIVYHTVSTTADSEVIQQDLNTLADWERRWGMEFHPMKCNVLSCTKS
ncbi:hypothetical protein ACOMHN_010057 [Nucella lapillus]